MSPRCLHVWPPRGTVPFTPIHQQEPPKGTSEADHPQEDDTLGDPESGLEADGSSEVGDWQGVRLESDQDEAQRLVPKPLAVWHEEPRNFIEGCGSAAAAVEDRTRGISMTAAQSDQDCSHVRCSNCSNIIEFIRGGQIVWSRARTQIGGIDMRSYVSIKDELKVC